MPSAYQSKPVKTYAETDILKDSDIWDYLKYLQLNRINWLSSTIWDTDKDAKNQLLNMIGAVSQMEFMCWEKIKLSETRKQEYFAAKPNIFKSMKDSIPKDLELAVNGDQMKQLQLLFQLQRWLKQLDVYFTTMKRMKKTAFVSGEGEFKAQQQEETGSGE